MYSCAVSISKNCFGTNVGYRGICSSCYNCLVEMGEIKQGDKFNDFPQWLQEMIRFEAAKDTAEGRHPTENYDEIAENSILGNNYGLKLYKKPSCV